jgi:Cdc6-like AAA superfamily ATPase
MPNPFAFGGRITDPSHFVGRQAELGRIFGALETAHTGQLQHISITGPRRIGKSSLLYHVTQIHSQRLQQPEKYRFVYVDLDNANCHTLDGLLGFILKQLGISHSNHTTLTQFQKEIELLRQKRGIYAALFLDEFEHLTKRKEQFPSEVFEAWRSLAGSGTLAFVTASQVSLGELIQQGNLTSTFHNIFTHVPLGEFTEEEARALLARNTDRPFKEYETLELFELTEKHPARLQIAAQLLYEAKGQSTVDWKKLKAEYKKQIAQIEPVKAKTKFGDVLRAISVTFPTSLGRFVLELFKNDTASDTTAAILGWVILLVILAVLLGLLNLEPYIMAWLNKGK